MIYTYEIQPGDEVVVTAPGISGQVRVTARKENRELGVKAALDSRIEKTDEPIEEEG